MGTATVCWFVIGAFVMGSLATLLGMCVAIKIALRLRGEDTGLFEKPPPVADTAGETE